MSAAMRSMSLDTASDISTSPKFAPFSIIDVTYKTVRNTRIEASVLVPKSNIAPPSNHKHPLAVRWHGGFLMTGTRLFADWYPQFVLDFYLKHDAVAITVDYRLMPEASGTDIIQDVKNFYAWLVTPGNLASHLPTGVEVDLENILVTGESGGGYLVFHSALIAPSVTKAVLMHYPLLDLRDPHYTKAYTKQIFDPPAPQIPTHILAD